MQGFAPQKALITPEAAPRSPLQSKNMHKEVIAGESGCTALQLMSISGAPAPLRGFLDKDGSSQPSPEVMLEEVMSQRIAWHTAALN